MSDKGHAPKHRRHGKLVGMPYDWRKPSLDKLRRSYWDTTTRRVVTPKAFGWGWDINMGALARRLRLVKNPPVK